MGLLDRALNIGESKRFREYERRVARIADYEPELELESDDELRERMDGLRERARDNARDLRHAINLCEEELSRQVKRHREKRRGRRKVGAETIRTGGPEELEGGTQAAF